MNEFVMTSPIDNLAANATHCLTPFRPFATPTMLPGSLTAILRTLLLVTPVFSANAKGHRPEFGGVFGLGAHPTE